MKRLPLFPIWIAYVALIAIGGVFSGKVKINTDFLSIFPKYTERGEFYKANAIYEENFENEIVVFITNPNKDLAIIEAQSFQKSLEGNDLFSQIQLKFENDNQEKLAGFLYSKRQGLLTQKQIQEIKDGKTENILDRALQNVYSPTGLTSQLTTDPLNLFQDYYLNAAGNFKLKPYNGYLISTDENESGVFIRLKVNRDAEKSNERLVQFYENSKANTPGFYAYGASLFSSFGSEKSMEEVNLYGSLSLIGVLVLLIWSFSSVVPVIASLLTIVISIASGFMALAFLYPSIHILSLLLGISVLGIVTDYCTHFFAKGFDEKLNSSEEVIKKIKSALGIGFLTNVLTYVCFYFTDLVVLKQLSVFTVVGIFTTYLTVIAAFPKIKFKKLSTKHFLRIIKFSKVWEKYKPMKSMAVIAAIVIIGYFVVGGFKFNDNVRLLQTVNQDLKKDEDKVFGFLGTEKSPFYYVVRGKDQQSVLLLEEELSRELSKLNLKSIAVSNFVPSLQKQEESAKSYQDLRITAKIFYNKIGSKDLSPLEKVFAPKNETFVPSQFFEISKNLPVLMNWLGELDGQYYSILNVSGESTYDTLKVFESDSVHLVGKAHDLSSFLGNLRQTIMGQFALVMLVLAAFLIFVFKFKKALVILFAPAISAFATLVITMGISGHLNLFNILAVILIFCLGMDYSVFFAQSKESTVATHIGVFISFLSTIGSFGILGLSSTNAVSSFGLSVCIGICLCYWIAPLTARDET